MGVLKDAVREIKNARIRMVSPPELAQIEKESRRIAFDEAHEGFRRDRDYDQIASELNQKLINNETLTRKELSDSIWCLWSTSPALAHDKENLDQILLQISQYKRPRHIRALAASFLRNFDADLPGVKNVTAVLSAHAPIARAPYDQLHSQFQIFDVEAGPDNLANQMLTKNISIEDLFARYGLGELVSKGEYAAYCALKALLLIEKNTVFSPEQRLSLVRNISSGNSGNIQFEGHKAAVANALLLPYSSQDPEKPDRDRTLQFLIDVIGDPRLRPARWVSMQEAESIALRWLTEQSLRQFLDIVDRIAQPHMWRYRRRFWEAVHNYGLIDSAWVIFDSLGQWEASRSFGEHVKFGRFRDSVQKGHAVLLLRIGNSVVAEWSHNGRCHIWMDASEGPQLYKNYYTTRSLHATPSGNFNGRDRFSQVHSSSDRYTWQAKIANRIYLITGRRIRQIDYKVKP